MDKAGVDAEDGPTSFRAKNVRVSDVQVVARDRDVKIVFQCQRYSVVHGKINLAVAHDLIYPSGVHQIRWRNLAAFVGRKHIGKRPIRFGVVRDREILRSRRRRRRQRKISLGRLRLGRLPLRTWSSVLRPQACWHRRE